MDERRRRHDGANRDNRAVSRCALTVLAAMGAILSASCSEQGSDGGEQPTTPAVADIQPGEPGRQVRVLGELPPFALTDRAGESFGSAQLSDRIWVATFIFTRCTSTCPRQTARMQTLQASLAKHSLRDSLGLVSITVDPTFDTPAVLDAYATAHGADPARWHFLTGSRDEIWDLSKNGFRLDVREDPGTPEMPILHSTQMILVDTWGRIRGYYDGLSDTEFYRLERDIDAVAKERRRTFSNEELPAVPWMKDRRTQQIAESESIGVFHDFSFEDRLAESGITFRSRVTPDGMWTYKASHYDHGNGISLADVDGDGLTDVYLTSQVGGSELWRNLGEGRFEDVTERSGLRLRTSVTMTATFADFDNDGDPDVFVTGIRSGNRLFANDGTGAFTDVTAAAGVGYVGHSSQALAFDYDHDGLLDMFVANVGVYTSNEEAPASRTEGDEDLRFHVGLADAFAGHVIPGRREASILYRNLGDMRFKDVTAEMGLAAEFSWAGAAIPLDGNRDGWPDLYVMNMQGRDEYYENDGGTRFTNRTDDVFPVTPWGAMGGALLDFDGDGDLDLYVTDMHSDMFEDLPPDVAREADKMAVDEPESFLRTNGKSIFGSALFRNDGPDRFVEVSASTGAETYWPWGPSVGDLNADGYPDLVVPSGMGFHYRYQPNAVLLNDAGVRFRQAEFVLGVEPRSGGRMTKPWTSLDCSGADRELSLVWFLGQRGDVEVWDALSSRAAAVLDLDDDGDLDILMQDWAWTPQVLMSDLAQRQPALSFLKIRLVGTRSNRDGLGARVTVRAGTRRLTQPYDGRTGYLSQGTLPLYFGLGAESKADAVEVRWPSGASQTVVDGIPVNGLLEIREPE